MKVHTVRMDVRYREHGGVGEGAAQAGNSGPSAGVGERREAMVTQRRARAGGKDVSHRLCGDHAEASVQYDHQVCVQDSRAQRSAQAPGAACEAGSRGIGEHV